MLSRITSNIINILADSDSPFTDNEFLEKIFPNVWDFVIQFAAFVILLVIVFFLGYKPVKKLLKKRHDYVDHNISDSEAAKAISERNARISAENIEKSKVEADKIVSNAKSQASKEADGIVNKARQDALETRKQADRDIAAAQVKAQADTRKQIVDVALSASSQILGREVNSEDNARLVDDFVATLEQEDQKKKKGKK